MEKLKRLILCHTDKKHRNKNRSTQIDARKPVPVANSQTEKKDRFPFTARASHACVPHAVDTGPQGKAIPPVLHAGEKSAAVSQTVPTIPTGPAAWKHKSVTVIVPPEPRDCGAVNRPYKRRRRGRRGRRRKTTTSPNANTNTTTNEIQIQPLQFITSREDQEERSSSEDGETVDGDGDVNDAGTTDKLEDGAKSPRVKAFNLTFLKYELLSMQETIAHIKSLKEAKTEESYDEHLATETDRFEEKLQSLLESVSKAESAQWSNLESHAAAKGRRPR